MERYWRKMIPFVLTIAAVCLMLIGCTRLPELPPRVPEKYPALREEYDIPDPDEFCFSGISCVGENDCFRWDRDEYLGKGIIVADTAQYRRLKEAMLVNPNHNFYIRGAQKPIELTETLLAALSEDYVFVFYFALNGVLSRYTYYALIGEEYKLFSVPMNEYIPVLPDGRIYGNMTLVKKENAQKIPAEFDLNYIDFFEDIEDKEKNMRRYLNEYESFDSLRAYGREALIAEVMRYSTDDEC